MYNRGSKLLHLLNGKIYIVTNDWGEGTIEVTNIDGTYSSPVFWDEVRQYTPLDEVML